MVLRSHLEPTDPVSMRYSSTTLQYDLVTQKRIEAGETSFHKMTLKSINSVDIDQRESLLSSIVIAGGNSLTPGFIERFEKNLFQIAPQVYLLLSSDCQNKGIRLPKGFWPQLRILDRRVGTWLNWMFPEHVDQQERIRRSWSFNNKEEVWGILN